jgi:deoxycytidylate deaminase
MVDSRNARRGADNINIENLKAELKKLNRSLLTSDYFQFFDEVYPKNMSSKQNYYLRIAAEVAMNSEMNHKHGAVLVHRKNIIAVGYNYNLASFSIHAEVAAISQLKGRDKDVLCECELYVVRIGTSKYDNALKYSKPCINCQNYITKKCIKKTYYSTNYEFDNLHKCMNCIND